MALPGVRVPAHPQALKVLADVTVDGQEPALPDAKLAHWAKLLSTKPCSKDTKLFGQLAALAMEIRTKGGERLCIQLLALAMLGEAHNEALGGADVLERAKRLASQLKADISPQQGMKPPHPTGVGLRKGRR